ncbi:MAG TPA: MarR family transcriptional regulator [Candidatus Mediterraneibacter vanvlietii]|nr:MarR family transcriptional regulator [Candidatus Mediterraneibacter vanvlietii]
MKLIKWLSVSDRFTKMYLDQQLAPFGINSSQHMYITVICNHPGITQEQFMKTFYLNPSNITRALNALIKSGFITRETSEQDKRTYCLYPTQKSYDTYEHILRITDDAENYLLDGFSVTEKKQFLEMLNRVGLRAVSLTRKKGVDPRGTDTDAAESTWV